jgi:DNA invertase Pin-like site-specific DNA recombinase
MLGFGRVARPAGYNLRVSLQLGAEAERAQAGLSRARAQGKVLGWPRVAVRAERVLALRQRGLSIRQIAEELGISAMTAQRLLKAGGAAA